MGDNDGIKVFEADGIKVYEAKMFVIQSVYVNRDSLIKRHTWSHGLYVQHVLVEESSVSHNTFLDDYKG